jgi:hypothetical protein
MTDERTRGGPHEKPIVKTPTQARQGVELHLVRYVLWYSLAGVIVLMGAVAIYFQLHH